MANQPDLIEKRTILVVDDTLDNLSLMANVLKKLWKNSIT